MAKQSAKGLDVMVCAPRFFESIPGPGELVISRDSSGLRHFLDGRPVYCGSHIEFLAESANGAQRWVLVRYEAEHDGPSPKGVVYLASGRRATVHSANVFRWPVSA